MALHLLGVPYEAPHCFVMAPVGSVDLDDLNILCEWPIARCAVQPRSTLGPLGTMGAGGATASVALAESSTTLVAP